VIHSISCSRSATVHRTGLILALLLLLARCPRALAELPLARLTAIFPAGGQAGSTVELTLTGSDLDELARLHFARPGLSAKPKVSPTGVPEPGRFVVAIDASVPPGLYDLRAVGRFGITNPRTFVVSSSPEIAAKPGNTSPASAAELSPGSAVHAIAEPNARHFYRIPLKHNDRLLIDVLATAIDSKMEPVLLLSDAAGRELAHSLRGGSLTASAPADGDYFLAVHDVLYRGGPEYFYRVSARVLDPSSAASRAPPGPLRWPFPPASGFLDAATLAAPVSIDDTVGPIRTLQPPCDVTSAFRFARPRDVYQFDAPAGSVFWIEILCHRLGQMSAAPFMLVQRVTKDDKGAEKFADVQEVYEPPAGGTPEFSTAARDPVYRLESKEGGTYRLLIRNLFHGLEADAPVPYRLVIRHASPDFALVAVPASPLPDPKDSRDVPLWSTLLRRGGTTPITVVASRRDNYAGDIRLEVENLPAGVFAGPATIPAGTTLGTILLTARADAAPWAGPIHIRGVATIDEKPVSHDARPATVALSTYDAQAKTTVVRSRLSEEVAIAVIDAEPSPLTIAVPATQPSLEVTTGGKLSIPLQLKRAADLAAPTTFKLAGHPLLAGFKETTADPKADSSKLELDLAQIKLPPGEYTLHAEAQAKLKYANNPEAAKAAQAGAQEAEKASADAAAALKAAEAGLAEAAKGADAAAKSAAERAVADANATAAAAEARKAAAQARAKDLAAKAQPRDVTASFYSPSLVVRVVAPPAAAAAAAPAPTK
jgi:hypothetical protein